MISSRLWLLVLVLGLLSFGLPACGDDADDSETTTDDDDDSDGDNTDDDDDDDDDTTDDDDDDTVAGEPFRFTIISDTHVRLPGNPDDGHYDNQENLDQLEAAITRINTEYSDSAFVAVTGDLVGCNYSDNPDDYGIGEDTPAETFKSMMDELVIPYHAILGNHDYQKDYDEEIDEGITVEDYSGIEAVWNKVLGIDPYYSVVVEGVRMIFLNSNRGEARYDACTGCEEEAYCTGSFDEEQLTWFEGELAQPEPAILFFHHPPITDNAEVFDEDEALFSFAGESFYVDAEDGFYDLTQANKDKILAIFVGHGHIAERDMLFETIPVYETPAVGDTGGNKDHMHIVDVDPAGPTIQITLGRDVTYWGE